MSATHVVTWPTGRTEQVRVLKREHFAELGDRVLVRFILDGARLWVAAGDVTPLPEAGERRSAP